ncbi:hypothetical protein [Roseococcus sp. YIM B11640]|uniref:hypothetical protein n=1 Tax=Roseococcus sp. YIM B11640 TaxID=3133973 RepID=UPI003C7DD3B9
MARRKSTASHAWLAEAGWVFLMHSARLWAEPASAGQRLAVLAAEKQIAFAQGMAGALTAAARGSGPRTVAEAAVAPVRRRVRANARKLRGS